MSAAEDDAIEETIPSGFYHLDGVALSTGVDVGANLIPLVGGALAAAIGDYRSRKAAKAQHARDRYLLHLVVRLDARLGTLGQRIDTIEQRVVVPEAQDLIGRGEEVASDRREDSEVDEIADAVAVGVASGRFDDAAALLEIVARLKAGDTGVLRAIVRDAAPGMLRLAAALQGETGLTTMALQASLLRLDAAGLVMRTTTDDGETRWSPTKFGVDVALALGETAVRALPDGWTEHDVALLNHLIAIDATDPKIPDIDELATLTGRTVPEVDASIRTLANEGLVDPVDVSGSPYAVAACLKDQGYVWQAQHGPGGLDATVERVVGEFKGADALIPKSSTVIASALGLPNRLVAQLFRILAMNQLLTIQMDHDSGVWALPAVRLTRALASDEADPSE